MILASTWDKRQEGLTELVPTQITAELRQWDSIPESEFYKAKLRSVSEKPPLQKGEKQILTHKDCSQGETHLCTRTYSKGEKAPWNDLQVEFFHWELLSNHKENKVLKVIQSLRSLPQNAWEIEQS